MFMHDITMMMMMRINIDKFPLSSSEVATNLLSICLQSRQVDVFGNEKYEIHAEKIFKITIYPL
jgi:hypothetical protein